jgi:hypothetical protein
MKLATVNPQLDFGNLSTLLQKDVSFELSQFACFGSISNMLLTRNFSL